MPKKWQDAIDEKRAESRKVSSSIATTSKVRSVSDFLEEKVRAHYCELDYLQSVHEGIHRAYDSHLLSPEEFQDAVSPFLSSAKQVSAELGTICRQRKILEEDLEESVNAKRRRHGEPSREMLERAYTSSILERVMATRAKQQKDKIFKPRKFKKAVNDYYGINPDNGIDPGAGFCHVLGVFNAEDIKAAHIVPKSLNGDEIAHLFGVEELVPEDPRNGKIHAPFSPA
jgi:glycyl-tRNA synthetase beta subunit